MRIAIVNNRSENVCIGKCRLRLDPIGTRNFGDRVIIGREINKTIPTLFSFRIDDSVFIDVPIVGERAAEELAEAIVNLDAITVEIRFIRCANAITVQVVEFAATDFSSLEAIAKVNVRGGLASKNRKLVTVVRDVFDRRNFFDRQTFQINA